MTPYRTPAEPHPDSVWYHFASRVCEMATRNCDGRETHAYGFGHLRVLSSSIMAEYRGLVCRQNHVSLSVIERIGRRPNDDELTLVRHDFDMHDAEEDNHQPGRIRNLFLPLHLPRGTVGVCDCKSDETLVIEPDGFVWSKPRIPQV